MRRRRREGRDQGREDIRARRLQRQVRRSPQAGGGYSYYDFLQDRTFDIAGPNPTPEEQKKIDTAYTAYLAKERRNNEAAEAAARQQREQQELQARQLQQVALRTEVARVPVPVERPKVQQTVGQRKGAPCAKGSFSCDWPRLSESLNDLKKLFNPPRASRRRRAESLALTLG